MADTDDLNHDAAGTIACVDCRHPFEVSAAAAQQYRARGVALPVRCPVCREASTAPLVADPDGWCPYNWKMVPIWKVAVGLPVPKCGLPGEFIATHPGAFVVRALLDTGTSHTFAIASVFQRLQARPSGDRVTICGAEQECEHDTYRLDLGLPYTTDGRRVLLVENCPVTDGVLSWGGDMPRYDVVIGNDLMRHCRLTIDGPAARFRLERVPPPTRVEP